MPKDFKPALLVLAIALALTLKPIAEHFFWFDSAKRHRWEAAMAQCEARYTRPDRHVADERTVNPRVQLYGERKPQLIQNARILDGDGVVSTDLHDLIIANGLITHISPSHQRDQFPLTDSYDFLDAQGHILSPGLVEMHSHIGICTQPELQGVNDMFELMSPATPFTRVIDAFNIGDPAIKLNMHGGVTTSLVLPSANIISGEAFAFKMAVPESLSVEQMLVQWDPSTRLEKSKRHRWMKMACGENPKKRYKNRPEAPKSRMGLGYLFRGYMHRATTLKEEQDQWCSAVEQKQIPSTQFPCSVELEILTSLLRGQVSSNAHCYETFDIETLLRHAREWNFEVNALHHALDAYKIPDMLNSLPWNVTIATFATLWGFKKEAYQASLFSPEILDENGLNVVLTTDHPALPGHTLIWQAQIAHNYGLDSAAAFASVTGNPSRALGLDDRLGFVRKGYDADLVIWDKHPLQPGAQPLKVWIDGQQTLDLPLENNGELVAPKERVKNFERVVEETEDLSLKDYKITGIKKSFVIEDVEGGAYELLVKDGELSCFSRSCPSDSSVKTVALKDGHVIPGIVAIAEVHGLVDILGEHATGDGDVQDVTTSWKDPKGVLYTKDGIHLGSEHLTRALNHGVTRFVTPPFRSEGKKFITGVSALFPASAIELEEIIQDKVALHIHFGDAGKEADLPTTSSQIAALKTFLLDNQDAENIYGQVYRGELPLAAHVNSKDVIAKLLALQAQIGFKMVIVGGLESHLVADKLVKQGVPVIIKQWRCQRKFWDERRCLVGIGGEENMLTNLTNAGVLVGLAYTEDQDIRLALDQLAAAAKASGFTDSQAVKMVSDNLLTSLSIAVDAPESLSSLVVLEGSPVEYGSRVAAVIERGQLIRIFPDPEPDFDLYR